MGRYIYSDDNQVEIEVTGWPSRKIAELVGNALKNGYVGTGTHESITGDSSREWLAFSRATHAIYDDRKTGSAEVVELGYYVFPWPVDCGPDHANDETSRGRRMIRLSTDLVAGAAQDMLEALVTLESLLDFGKSINPGETITFRNPSFINDAFAKANAAIARAKGSGS